MGDAGANLGHTGPRECASEGENPHARGASVQSLRLKWWMAEDRRVWTRAAAGDGRAERACSSRAARSTPSRPPTTRVGGVRPGPSRLRDEDPSTTDGRVFDPLTTAVPSILRDTVVRAVDGLLFAGLIAIYAYRGGVPTAVVAPMGSGFLQGISTALSTGAPNALAYGAILQSESALPLRDAQASAAGPWRRVKAGEIPLVIRVHNADIMATLLLLNADFEASTSTTLRITFAGATKAHLLAHIRAAGVSVILAPARPYPESRDYHRVTTSPLALGLQSEYAARTVIYARFELAWTALSTTNLDKALGLEGEDMVMYQGGGLLDLESKVLGVVSGRRAMVDLF
ncbi:hypothetical protein FB451DRAFT_1374163 [Mycena latifolia]|nr:hypothetical protein FB451DRAFT_1374163 [Mycena latifolia]